LEIRLWQEVGFYEFLTVYSSNYLALASSFVAWSFDMPDPVLTQGAINPSVTQENIHQTACVKGYTKTIRPPAHFHQQTQEEAVE
jgi:hypothetical protein